MQCPFLFKSGQIYCKTGAFGLMVMNPKDHKKHCCSSSYYGCKVYRVTVGVERKDRVTEQDLQGRFVRVG